VRNGCADGSEDVIIGDMLKWGILMWAIGTDECVWSSTIIEEGYNVGYSSFDWATFVRDGLVGKDLPSVAVLLVVNAELYKVREERIGSDGGHW